MLNTKNQVSYGFGGKLWYAGFDMDFNFQGVYGNKILNLNNAYESFLQWFKKKFRK